MPAVSLGFGNRTVGLHLLRGLAGAAALATAVWVGSIWLALWLVPATLWAWKGCPTCWTIGLIETLARR